MFTCGKCLIKLETFSQLCNHLNCCHNGETYVCGLETCQRTFRNGHSYKTHGYKFHTAITHSDRWKVGNIQPVIVNVSAPIAYDFEASLPSEPIAHNSSDNCDVPSSIQSQVSNAISVLFVHARELHLLPLSTAQDIFQSFSSVLELFHEKYSALIMKVMRDHGLDLRTENIDLYNSMIDSNYVSQCFNDVSSNYMADRFIQNNLPYTGPTQIRLNVEDSDRPVYAQYVSIRQVVGQIFKCSDFLAESLSYLRTAPNGSQYHDFKDGSLYSCAPPQYNGNGILELMVPLLLYNDEFEVCNPLGSAKKVHKISAYYFSLLSVDPKYRSHKKQLHLACLVNDSLQRKFGQGKVIQPLLEEMKALATDPIVVGGIHIYLKLVAIAADNLTAHSVGGFQGTFSSGFICRHCLIPYGEHRECFDPSKFQLRTLENYTQHLDLAKARGSSYYGVANSSCLLTVPQLKLNPTALLPHDIMHDLLEGVVPATISLVIGDLIDSKVISLKYLNQALQTFKYSSFDRRSRYSCEITRTHVRECRIPGSASEKWSLVVFLPFIIGEKVPTSNESWSLLMKCREIVDVLLAERISKDDLLYLSRLISWFLAAVKEKGTLSITPKFHFLQHYPLMVERYGPPKRYWTMRFESLHQYFKDVVKRTRNFKNVTSSLAQRFQYRQACLFSSQPFLGECHVVNSGPGKSKSFDQYPTTLKDLLQNICEIGLFSDDLAVFEANWVEFEGSRYSAKLKPLVVSDIVQEEERIPLFIEISNILCIQSKWYLCGKPVIARGFCLHTWSYTVQHQDIWATIPLTTAHIHYHSPLSLYYQSGKHHVIMKHAL